jgi:glutathione synthase/RimK-type ligase-like ATP-grasp enzyme
VSVQIVTDDILTLRALYTETPCVDATSYLDTTELQQKNLRIINLCSSYDYQAIGYYVSLLAEARGHKVLPNVIAIQDIVIKNTCATINTVLEDEIRKSLRAIQSNEFELSVYFGKNIAKTHNALARKLYGMIPLPLFKVYFVKNKLWQAKKVAPMHLNELPILHYPFFAEVLSEYVQRKSSIKSVKRAYYYDIALLYNQTEKTLASNKKAIDKFIKVGRKLNINIEILQKEDFKIISEYDALFIRDTTAVNHYTYRFARKAAAEGLIVIDDPNSILKCTNKVYLAELLKKHNINMPKTIIINKKNYKTVLESIEYPCVIKLPDSSFSKGVIKAENKKNAEESCKVFFKTSDLIIIQEFMPSEYDWRIGIIDNKAIFACRYYMAKAHWQIYNWGNAKKSDQTGMFDTLPIETVPSLVTHTALKATKLIGNGLYGVDLKEVNGTAYVIEVNDNPNIDYGIEDQCLGNELYRIILSTFQKRLDESHGLKK